MKFAVEFTDSALRALKRIPKKDQGKIIEKCELLGSEPRPLGFKKLSGKLNLFRIRCGNYRVIYQISESIVTITIAAIGDRKDVYRWLSGH